MTAETQCNISNLETISRNPNDTMNNLIYLIVITSCCPLHVQTKKKRKRQKKRKKTAICGPYPCVSKET